MGFRYRVQDLPPVGMGAFTPLPSTNPIASSWGLVKVEAWLGTRPIAAPNPGMKNSAPQHAPRYQGSQNSPDFLLPSHYVAHADHMGPMSDAGIGMATRRHTPLPVPARRYGRVSKNAMIGRKTGGRVAMAWPRAFQRWPTRRTDTTV